MKIYNKRELELLKVLIDVEMESGEKLASYLNVSSRTIRSDIKELNRSLENEGACIISEHGKGYRLQITNNEQFQLFYQSLDGSNVQDDVILMDSKERIDYITRRLLESALNGEQIDRYELADSLYISDSTLKKDLAFINKTIAENQLKLAFSKNNGVRILGEETNIRTYLSEFVKEQGYDASKVNEFLMRLFSKHELDSIAHIIKNCIVKYDIALTEMAFQNFLTHTVITLKRVKKQSVHTVDTFECLMQSKEYETCKEIAKLIEQELHVNIDEEILYLTQHLIVSKKTKLGDHTDNQIIDDLINQMIQLIKEENDIDFSKDEMLMNGLLLHLTAALQRIRFNMKIRNEFLGSLKSSYPLAFELAISAGILIQKTIEIKIDENEIGYLAIHFGAALERKGLNKKSQVINAILVCESGIAMGFLMNEVINRKFKDTINIIKICPRNELNEELISDVDLIISAVSLNEFHSNKIVTVKSILSDDDLNKVSRKIEHIKMNFQKEIFETVIKKDLYYQKLSCSSKVEVLNYMTNVMVEKNYITKEEQQSVFEREEMATTELGSFIAVPHAMIDHTPNSMVSIAVLEKAIIWQENEVQIVILVNVPKSQISEWELIFKQLYHFLINQDGVSKLIAGMSYEQLINELIE